MNNPVVLVFYYITPSGVISSEIKGFENISSVLDFLDDIKEKMHLCKIELKSDYYCITFTASRYPAIYVGDYDIKINNLVFNTDFLMCLVSSLDCDSE